MSSMGIGSKPHLDLTVSSENRITDRSVDSTSTGDRNCFSERMTRSRTRVSIAVPTYEHLAMQKNLNKRPHSTISTSSSTSSVGSGNGQSASLIPSLALASWSLRNENKSAHQEFAPMAYCDFHAIAEDLNEDCGEFHVIRCL